MKILKWFLGIAALLGLLILYLLNPFMQKHEKMLSPKVTNVYQKKGFDLSVNYSSPSKKERVIFGKLVPFDVVWRTGANEPTKFTTTTAIKIANKNLPAATYSLWTIPGKLKWKIIFNKHIPDWGVTVSSGDEKTTRIPEEDVLEIEVSVEETQEMIEHFTIDFEGEESPTMNIAWDRTEVRIPITR